MKRSVLAITLALGGCIHVSSDAPPIVVNVTKAGQACRVTVTTDPYHQPARFMQVHADELRQIGRQTTSRHAIVVYDLKADYACVGAAIVTTQQAGFMVDAVPWTGP